MNWGPQFIEKSRNAPSPETGGDLPSTAHDRGHPLEDASAEPSRHQAGGPASSRA